MQRHSFTALNSTFVVDSEYQFVKELGQGAYGCVVAAKHRRTGDGCAIKKITNINTKVRRIAPYGARIIRTDELAYQRILTKRCLREIKYATYVFARMMLIVVERNLRATNKAPASFPQAQERELLETPHIMPILHPLCLPGHVDHLPLRHGHCLWPRW
jgi:serine/threonine protein kinase